MSHTATQFNITCSDHVFLLEMNIIKKNLILHSTESHSLVLIRSTWPCMSQNFNIDYIFINIININKETCFCHTTDLDLHIRTKFILVHSRLLPQQGLEHCRKSFSNLQVFSLTQAYFTSSTSQKSSPFFLFFYCCLFLFYFCIFPHK